MFYSCYLHSHTMLLWELRSTTLYIEVPRPCCCHLVRNSRAKFARYVVFCRQMLIGKHLTPFQQPAVAQDFILLFVNFTIVLLFWVRSPLTFLIVGRYVTWRNYHLHFLTKELDDLDFHRISLTLSSPFFVCTTSCLGITDCTETETRDDDIAVDATAV